MNWRSRSLGGLGMFLLLGLLPGDAQSLGDVARAERAKKEQGAPAATRVFTDDDLKHPLASGSPKPLAGGMPPKQVGGPDRLAGKSRQELEALANFYYSMMREVDNLKTRTATGSVPATEAEKAEYRRQYGTLIEEVLQAGRARGFEIPYPSDDSIAEERRQRLAAYSPEQRQEILKRYDQLITEMEAVLKKPCTTPNPISCAESKAEARKMLDRLRTEQTAIRNAQR